MDVREIKWGNIDWVYLAEDVNQRQALVNKVMNLPFHKRLENWQVTERQAIPQDCLGFKKLVAGRHTETRYLPILYFAIRMVNGNIKVRYAPHNLFITGISYIKFFIVGNCEIFSELSPSC
jgi:hypothetical protein